jgi:L-seryl-tRNA(Ser) seleniumtransferase
MWWNEIMARNPNQEILRQIPSVDSLLLRASIIKWIERTSRSFVTSQIQEVLREVRREYLAGTLDEQRFMNSEFLETCIVQRLQAQLRPHLKTVINATGVILHTNLGRAPLSKLAQQRLSATSAHYINLEYDLDSGTRSQRDNLIEPILREILSCEAATVVNNNAAAVFLILNALALGREVIVSRGELIEIGGSFRIPDIMARSGVILREVGTTNKTKVEDYAAAISPNTALLLRIHQSNYRILGFTDRPRLAELAALARQHQIPLVEDIGSGCLLDLRTFGIREEPVAKESVAAGADLICFSADKLLGGPQAGVIAGARQYVERVRKNPLMRPFRVDKLIYAALEATLESYRTGRAFGEIPVLRMISMTSGDLRARAGNFVRRLRKCLPEGSSISLVSGNSVVGGGACPDCKLPTTLIALESARHRPHAIEAGLRAQDPPIILRVEEDRALLDLRTVLPHQERQLIEGIVKALE